MLVQLAGQAQVLKEGQRGEDYKDRVQTYLQHINQKEIGLKHCLLEEVEKNSKESISIPIENSYLEELKVWKYKLPKIEKKAI